MAELLMPSLGADMDEGTVVEWLIKPGDEVHRGDIVAVVDTDKSDIDIESFQSGIVQQILVPPGERVAVGTPLAILGAEAPAATPLATAPIVTAGPDRGGGISRPRPPRPSPRRRPRHGRRIRPGRSDHPCRHRSRGNEPVGDVAAPPPLFAPPPLPAREVPSTRTAERPGMRNAIAALMTRSAQEIPHYYVATTIDLSATLRWVERINADRPVTERLLPIAVYLKATATAARRCTGLNGWWMDGGFQPAEHVHLGIATSLRAGGLVAPALHDVDEMDVSTIMRRASRPHRARPRRAPAQLRDGRSRR